MPVLESGRYVFKWRASYSQFLLWSGETMLSDLTTIVLRSTVATMPSFKAYALSCSSAMIQSGR